MLMGFHRKLKRVGQQLDIAIRDYEIEITEIREKSNGAANFWTSIGPPPKALPDILESFIGALFVDSEFSYEIVEKFVTDYILPYFVDMTVFDSKNFLMALSIRAAVDDHFPIQILPGSIQPRS